jgi:diguanylate cyclase (GGDEF)-like protein
LGGEEFLIIMPNAPAEVGMRRAEELRVRFDQMGVRFDQHILKATFSAGVACFPEDAQNTEMLLRAADTAMYAAKERGRNCVARAGELG